MESLPLLSGHTMPVVGLGTWPMRGVQCKEVMSNRLLNWAIRTSTRPGSIRTSAKSARLSERSVLTAQNFL